MEQLMYYPIYNVFIYFFAGDGISLLLAESSGMVRVGLASQSSEPVQRASPASQSSG